VTGLERHRTLVDDDPRLQQFAVDPRRSPAIVPRQPDDKLADFIGVDAVEVLLEFVALLHHGDVGRAEPFELRLVHGAIAIEAPAPSRST
jgi:hypothetical protein